MAPDHGQTDVLGETKISQERTTLPPNKSSCSTTASSSHLDDNTVSFHSLLESTDLGNGSDVESQTDPIWTNNRTDSTATDDSGIAAEFDSSYQTATTDDDEDESILSDSIGLINGSDVKQSAIVNSPVKTNTDNYCSVATTPPRTPRHCLHQSSTEDSPSSTSSPRSGTWSPARRGSATDILAERRRKRSQGDIGKRTAWLMERTESALEKSARVRKRSEDLIQTGKRLRNEEL